MRLFVFAVATLVAPALAFGQATRGMAMPPDPAPPTASGPPATPSMPAMATMAGMDMGAMTGQLVGYPMTRDASGTAWQPDASPMREAHGELGGWATMLHGYVAGVYDDQGGPRGDTKPFVESMAMGMAQRPLGGGVLTLRAMGSLDPTMGRSGYPLLLATGETADGRTPLVDRQHPHDLLMELASVYSHRMAAQVSGFVYVGWPGEPALGPATYMHRFSGQANPEAPIDHHWLDSTHISFGVVTAGVVLANRFKLEASSFTGREPNQNRWDLDHPRFDSWSLRASWNPTTQWSLQVSRARLVSPEQLTPNVDQDRTTASATYDRAFTHGNWQTTLAWGRDADLPGPTTDAWLLESAVSRGRHTVFGRAETVAKDELFAATPADPRAGRLYDVAKFGVGYFYTVPLGPLALDLGGLVSRYALPPALDTVYGADPTSFMLFMRVTNGA